jgi:hypothetical protein
MLPRAGFAGFVAVLVCAAIAAAQPAKPPPQAIELRLLPVWAGHVEGGAVQVHAVDVDAEVLRGVLAARMAYVTLPTDKRISGRIAVKTRAQALAALVTLEPSLAITSRPMRGGGVNVDLDLRGASTRDLYRLFADVLRTNIVGLAPDAKVTVRVKRKPAGGVLAEIARVAGVAIDRPASNLIVIRPADAPRTPRLAAGGATLRLDARQIHAGHLVELIRQLDGPRSAVDVLRDAALMCSGGHVIDLRLTKIATRTALAAVELAGGADLRGPRCALPPLPPGATVDLRLLATVERGGQRLAAVERAGKVAVIVDGAGGWRVADSWIEHVTERDRRAWQLDPATFAEESIAMSLGPAVAEPLSIPLRLAATVIDGRERYAIVEFEGKSQVLVEGKLQRVGNGQWIEVQVQPGRADLVADGFSLRLSR